MNEKQWIEAYVACGLAETAMIRQLGSKQLFNEYCIEVAMRIIAYEAILDNV